MQRVTGEGARVDRRLKFGRLSPVILDAYRKGDIWYEILREFEHRRPERVERPAPDQAELDRMRRV
jgi:hypothetical protein